MPNRFWPIYERIEKEFCDLAYSVEVCDVHLSVYSSRLVELLLRLGAEADAIGKYVISQDVEARGTLTSDKIQRLSFPVHHRNA
jgi:hypothetical protein